MNTEIAKFSHTAIFQVCLTPVLLCLGSMSKDPKLDPNLPLLHANNSLRTAGP